ncbi:uncharacterized protein [Amphiura filiformis]|uniref:uncharacterized protein n=1 Tax=Amphiura filiformis TaxID=82378 RepID=UPI003B21D3C9
MVAHIVKLLGYTNVQGSKYKIREISCTTDQMNEIGNYVLEGVGLLEANSVSNETEITERCVYIENIPYVTDEQEQVEDAIKKHVESQTGTGIERVICRVQGSMDKVIAVFKSVKDRENFQFHGDQQFFNQTLKVEKLPPVFNTGIATVDNSYFKRIPRQTLKMLVSSMKADFGAYFTSDGKKLMGTVQQIQEAVPRIYSAFWLPENRTMSDRQSHVVEDYFSHPLGASNYHTSSPVVPVTAITSTVYPSATNRNQQTRISSSFIPVDKMIYQYMKLNLKQRLEGIEQDHHVKIKFDSYELHLQEQDQIVVELKRKKETADIARAQEELLALQTEVQKDTMAVSVSCKGVDKERFKKKFPKIVVAWKNDTECVLLGKKATVETAAQELNDTVSCYESTAVDEMTFEYLSTVRKERLEAIKRIYNVEIELQDEASSNTNQKMAHIKPIKRAWKKKCKLEDLHEAKEAFIDLYQQTFFSLKRVPVKCHGISQTLLDRAIKGTKQTLPAVIIMKLSSTKEIIICAKEETVDDVVREFRSLAGLVSRRKLKKVDSDGKEQLTQRSQQTNYAMSNDGSEGVPSSRFQANVTPSWDVTAKADITTKKVDIAVNSANACLKHTGGVANTILAAGGTGLQRERDDILKGKYIMVGECLLLCTSIILTSFNCCIH